MIKDEISRQLFLNLTVTNKSGTRPCFIFVTRLRRGTRAAVAKGPEKSRSVWKPEVTPPEKIKPIPKKKDEGGGNSIQGETVPIKRAPLSRAMISDSKSMQWVPAEKLERFLLDLFS